MVLLILGLGGEEWRVRSARPRCGSARLEMIQIVIGVGLRLEVLGEAKMSCRSHSR